MIRPVAGTAITGSRSLPIGLSLLRAVRFHLLHSNGCLEGTYYHTYAGMDAQLADQALQV